MKKVAIVVGSSVVGGAEKQSLLLAEHLNFSFQIEMVFLGKPGPLIDVAIQSGFKVWSSTGSLISDLKTIFICLYKFKPNCQINFLYRADALGGIVGKILRVPTIINSARNTSWPNYNLKKGFLLKVVSKVLPSHIVANSEAAEVWHLSLGYPKSKLVVIPNFLSVKALPEHHSVRSRLRSPVRIGIASRAVVGKGHQALIEACKILKESGLLCEIWFIGYGIPNWSLMLEENKKGEVKLNLQDGELNLAPWFQDIDIYCGISESWESDSNSVSEAVLNMVPIVVSELISVVDYYPTPLQVKAGDPTSIAEGILDTVRTPLGKLELDSKLRQKNLILNRGDRNITGMWLKVIQEPQFKED